MRRKIRKAKIGEFREVPGPIGKELLERADEALSKTTVGSKVVLEKGDGIIVRDVDGNKYLCFDAGVGVASLGFGRKQRPVWKGVEKAVRDGIPLYIGTDRFNPRTIEAAELIKEITPIRGGKSKVYFATMGTLATEAIIKAIAKTKLHQSGGKIPPQEITFIHFEKSFHGRSGSALVIMDKARKERVEGYSLPYKSIALPFPNSAQKEKFLAELNKLAVASPEVLNTIGGVFIEMVQGEGGINVADKSAIWVLAEWCQDHNIPLIVDEIQTGFCRTGTFWAYEEYDIRPDAVLFGKGAGGGVLPITGVVMADDLSFRKLGEHSATFGPDPILTTALSATIKTMQRQRLAERAKIMGNYFMQRLDETFGGKPWLKEIRGLGLLIGMEFCHPITKQPFPEFRNSFWHKLENFGFLTFPAGGDSNPVIRFEPALTVSIKDIDTAIKILEKAAFLAETEFFH